MSFSEPKSELRRRLRSELRRFGDLAAATASANIRAHLLAFFASEKRPLTVAAFASLPGEPELLPLLEEVSEPEISWHFPRVDGDQLQFFPVRSVADLTTGAYGIREPKLGANHTPPTPLASIDCFLVPGLGFDPSTGRRIGRGKGYYDRCLAQARSGAGRVGVALDLQLCHCIPVEPHDIPMRHVITESGVRSTSAG